MLKRPAKRIYADAAAATPLSPRARRELLRLLDCYGNAGALHREGLAAKRELDAARASVAASIGAHPDEIVFTGSGTEGNNLAIVGALRPLLRAHGPLRAVTCAIEHASILEPLRALASEGLSLTELPVDGRGVVSLDALREALAGEGVVFVSVQLVNSEIGTIQPLRDIAREVRHARRGRSLPLLLHSDASQGPLWLPMRVDSLGVDLLTLDAQKLMGPKGVGALYVRRGASLEPVLLGSKQERGLRGGTENVPLVGAFAAALAEAQAGTEARAARVAAVRDALWEDIHARVPEVLLNGPDWPHRVANNLNLSVPGLDREMAVLGLDALGVAATTRSACTVAESDPSPVIVALGGHPARAAGAVRVTLLPDATPAQARRIAAAFAEVVGRWRLSLAADSMVK